MDLHALHETPPWEWPDGTDRLLLGILRSEAASDRDRMTAVGMAGEIVVMNDGIAAALLSIVVQASASDALRAAAAIALGATLEQADADGLDLPGGGPVGRSTIEAVQATLRSAFNDAGQPGDVRRKVLEASVRAPEEWHSDAIRHAYASGDREWMRTAVFCMRFVAGFEDEIVEALRSEFADIHLQAVCAAGEWGVEAAWPHVAALIAKKGIDKELLLAAIDAVAGIRPQAALEVLRDLLDSPDDDVVDAVHEALARAGGDWDDEDL